MSASEVHLNRSFTNNGFSSWRLGSDPAPSLVGNFPLPGTVRREEQQSYDYLHTRLSLLANRLYVCGSAPEDILYTFLEDSHGLSLYKFSTAVGLNQVAALCTPETIVASPGVASAAELECSLAAVQIPDDQAQQSDVSKTFIASNGHGDMVLITESGTSTVVPVSVSAAQPALEPFILEAAYQVLPGIMRVVLWTVQSKTNERPASCVLYLATISYDPDSHSAHVKALHTLGQSKLPPHAVVVSAKDDAVALAIDPADPHAPAGSNPGLGAGGLPEDAPMDMDDDVPSPRTLRAAAEHLAQYTSEAQEPSSGPIGNMFSDLYSEASPADEAANLETESVVYFYTCRPAANLEPPTPSKDDVQLEEAAAEPVQPSPQQEALIAQPQLVKEVSCSPYKLLTSQASGMSRHAAFLGLIDDVDCAVVSINRESTESAAFALEHVASIPAFSYVVTGKPQRKFVLLGTPGQKVAAVIVEANKFAFIYDSVPCNLQNGTHQVLDLGLPKDESVIGAALLGTSHGNSVARLVIMTERSVKVYNLH